MLFAGKSEFRYSFGSNLFYINPIHILWPTYDLRLSAIAHYREYVSVDVVEQLYPRKAARLGGVGEHHLR